MQIHSKQLISHLFIYSSSIGYLPSVTELLFIILSFVSAALDLSFLPNCELEKTELNGSKRYMMNIKLIKQMLFVLEVIINQLMC